MQPIGRMLAAKTVLVPILAIAMLLIGFTFGRTSAQIELPQQPYVPLDLALNAASAALAQCTADGYNVSVAVVDRSGVLKVLLKGDGAGPHTVNSSWKKAYTSASLGRSTAEYAANIAANPEIEGLRNMDPQLLFLAGGLPIVVNEAVVGGIGVGGAPGGQFDEACAQAGIDILSGSDGAQAEATVVPAEESETEATAEPAEETAAEATPAPTATAKP